MSPIRAKQQNVLQKRPVVQTTKQGRSKEMKGKHYINGFVIGQDLVHGVPTWKVRIKEPGHSQNRKKCRIVSCYGIYNPRKGDEVHFVLGSTEEGGQRINLAYEVGPIFNDPNDTFQDTAPLRDTMNWFLVRSDGRVYAACLGARSLEEAQADLGEDEQVIAFIPFAIAEYITRWDDPGTEAAFALVAALSATAPTLQALEKLVTAIVQAAVKKSQPQV
jgi:hypothetical protein